MHVSMVLFLTTFESLRLNLMTKDLLGGRENPFDLPGQYITQTEATLVW